MIDDPIAVLARANPVPPTVAPEPIDGVLARIADETVSGDRPRISPAARPLRFIAPMIGTAVALAVAAAAIVLVHAPAHHRTPSGSPTTPATPSPGFVPAGGMRGMVAPDGVAFSSRDDGVVSITQSSLGHPPRTRDWLATTHNAGRSWNVVRTSYALQSPMFADAKDGWAFGVSQVARYYVTHDGGASWRPARLTDGQIAYTTPLAVAGGAVWAVGNQCPIHKACRYAVLRGIATGSTLAPTPSQPAPKAQTMIIAAGSAETAYETTTTNGGGTVRTYGTHDGGRHWTRITTGCPGSAPAPIGNTVLWETCAPDTVAISHDSGASWQRHTTTLDTITQVVPTSATTAWAVTSHHALLRTTDAGRRWHGYPYRRPPAAGGQRPDLISPLSVLSATSAAIAIDFPTGHHRTQIMVVRALGPTNPSTFIRLPAGLG